MKTKEERAQEFFQMWGLIRLEQYYDYFVNQADEVDEELAEIIQMAIDLHLKNMSDKLNKLGKSV